MKWIKKVMVGLRRNKRPFLGAKIGSSNKNDVNQVTYGGYAGIGPADVWIPAFLPDAILYTLTQTGGTSAITSTIDLEIDCTGGAATRYYSYTYADTDSTATSRSDRSPAG